jgi:hypothetical protein
MLFQKTQIAAATYEHGGGLARFGIVRSKLIPWSKLQNKAQMAVDVIMALEVERRRQGANPSEWYGTCKPLPLSKIQRIELMNEHGNWGRSHAS